MTYSEDSDSSDDSISELDVRLRSTQTTSSSQSTVAHRQSKSSLNESNNGFSNSLNNHRNNNFTNNNLIKTSNTSNTFLLHDEKDNTPR